MPNSDTPSASDMLEQRRLRAWELHQQGWSQRRIAAELGVTQGAVSQWLRRVRESGSPAALHSRAASGRRGALSPEQLAQIRSLMAAGADAYGFKDGRWTTRRVAQMLYQVFGVRYHPAHVSRLLHKYYPDWRIRKPD